MRFAFIVSWQFVFERKECAVLCRLNANRNPADVSTKFPSKGQRLGRVAGGNITVRVISNRKPTAKFKVARDFGELP